ncbi:MAG TPA: FkbM family methyltransferase [Bacteroidia bacterium]
MFKGVKKNFVFKNQIQFKLHLDDWIQQNLFFLDGYEDLELQFLEASLKEGSVFVDIGANIGLFSLVASQKIGKNGRVISFEPFKKNFDALKKNISLNNSENIKTEKLAVAQTKSQMPIFYDPKESNQGMASLYSAKNPYYEQIETISLDEYFKDHSVGEVDFIKLDIEGGEYPALLGMKETLLKYGPKLLIEIDDEILSNTPFTSQQILSYLSELGYNKYFLDQTGELS